MSVVGPKQLAERCPGCGQEGDGDDVLARKYGEGVEVRVRFTSDRSGMGCGGYELLGPVEDDD